MRAWLAKSLLLCLIAGSAPYQGDDQQKNGKAADKSAGTAAFEGIWEGILSVPPGLELQIVFKVTTTKGGEAKATYPIFRTRMPGGFRYRPSPLTVMR